MRVLQALHALVPSLLLGTPLDRRNSLAACAGLGGLFCPGWNAKAADVPFAGNAWSSVEVPGIGAGRFALVSMSSGARAIVCSDAALTRCQLALTVGCGSLDDPAEIEGLAHLAEHVTLASDTTGLQQFVEERGGELNAFTGERTTTFYAQFDLGKRVRRGTTADGAESTALGMCAADVAAGCASCASLLDRALAPPPVASPAEVIKTEVRRIQQELEAVARSPPRGLVELAALKARAAGTSAWRRLGRGGSATLLPDGEGAESVRRLSTALAALRRERYGPDSATIALCSPLPLEQAVAVVGGAFTGSVARGVRPAPRVAALLPRPASAASTPRLEDLRGPRVSPMLRRFTSERPRREPRGEWGGERRGERPTLPFPDYGGLAPGGAMAIARPARYSALRLSFALPFDDPVAAARTKPLALIGHALTSPHAGGLSDVLRSRGLAPLAVGLDTWP